VLRTRYTECSNAAPLPAIYSAKPAEIPGERSDAGLLLSSAGRKYIGELSDAQVHGGGQPFSVEPELQMCCTCTTDGF
jgi:hypothetical protein